MTRIISLDKSIVPACDVSLGKFVRLLDQTEDLELIGGYKVPLTSGLEGWETWVDTAREHTNKPLIFDGQKLATDIPDTGRMVMENLSEADFDAVILFPQSGPVTAYEWILAAQESGLEVIVGGEMTHPRFLNGNYSNSETKNYSEIFTQLMGRDLPGFMRSDAAEDIYELAARMGVTNFVMPGNKPDSIRRYIDLIKRCGVENPFIFSPGLVKQGGDVTESGTAAGDYFHAIVGRGIYDASNMRQAAIEYTSKLYAAEKSLDSLIKQA